MAPSTDENLELHDLQVSWSLQSKPSLKTLSVNKAFCFEIDLKNIFRFSRQTAETFSICLKKNRETSQNFNSIRQPIEKMKITIVFEAVVSKYIKLDSKDGACCPNFQ